MVLNRDFGLKNTTVNPHCPCCDGKGTSPAYWDIQQGRAKEDDKVPCFLCHAGFKELHAEALAMLERTSGKNTNGMSWEEQDDLITGEEGQRFRRILKWLWEHPEDLNQDRNGMQKGVKPTKTTPFKKLFNFERKAKAPKKYKPISEWEFPVIPLCVLTVKELKKAWAEVSKGMRDANIPVLNCVKVDINLDSIRIARTDLDVWVSRTVPAYSFQNAFAVLLPGKKVRQILQSCNPKGDIAMAGNKPGIVYLKHESLVWTINTLDPKNYPLEPEEPESDNAIADSAMWLASGF